MLQFLDSIIKNTVNLIFPVPLLKDVLSDILCKYKGQLIGILVVFVSLPILIIGLLLSSQPKVSDPATEEIMKRQYFDRQYSVNCRDNKDTVSQPTSTSFLSTYICEVRPEYLSEIGSQSPTIFCKNQPNKCRPIRPKIDCVQMPQRCETIDIGTAKSTNTITKPIAGEDEKFYQEQQTEQENKQNIFKWIEGLWSGLTGDNTNNINSQNPNNSSYNNPNNNQRLSVGTLGIPQNVIPLPDSLSGYIEPGFLDSGTPNGNPFGGSGYNWVNVSCSYLCSGYSYNGGKHLGLDIVPYFPNSYHTKSQAYIKSDQYIVMSTCSGIARSTYEQYGGNYVIIKCHDSPYIVIYMHLSAQFVPATGISVKAGQPVGIMGSTGINTTGPHLHYQIGTCEQYIITCTVDPDRFLGG